MRHTRGYSSPPAPLHRKSALAVDTKWQTPGYTHGTPPVTPHRHSLTLGFEARNIAESDTSSPISRQSSCNTVFEEWPLPSSDKILDYPYQKKDYEVLSTQPLGSGRFSDIYLAELESSTTAELLTPPSTPVLSRSRPTPIVRSSTRAFAIKRPADRSSVAVLATEAAILSYLSSRKAATDYIVPFLGRDPRDNALVFHAMPCDLETYITKTLNTLASPHRTKTVVNILPRFTNHLCDALNWLRSTGIVHADIKTANILLDFEESDEDGSIPVPLLADFTSSFHVSTPPNCASSSISVGGGTYDYLAPELLKRKPPPPSSSNSTPNSTSASSEIPTPTFASDIWALTITILTLIIGQSPFRSAANRFMLIEWVKAGRPLDFVDMDDLTAQRMGAIYTEGSQRGFDVFAFLRAGFEQDPEKRRLGTM